MCFCYNIITHKANQILYSYQTPVAVITSNGHIYKTKQKYSVTTSRHINKFLEGLESEEVNQNFTMNLFSILQLVNPTTEYMIKSHFLSSKV